MAARKSYNQNCPLARGLDLLGERWTLLVLRELIGGARRYSDLRAALPGIATNLLADRLRELEESDVVDRTELPPPVARTVYTLSETGWRKVPPVIQAIAKFGLDLIEPDASALTPLNGFLAGILLAFDPARAADLLAAPRSQPDASVSATAGDVITSRVGSTPAERKAALKRLKFDGEAGDINTMRSAFQLTGDPRLAG